MIYVALRALAADPGLWRKYVEQPGPRQAAVPPRRFARPRRLASVPRIESLPDREVRELLERLLRGHRGPIDQVPSLAELTDSYVEIEKLLRQAEWEEAVKLLNRRKQFRDAPRN